jgi:hypothetical protein
MDIRAGVEELGLEVTEAAEHTVDYDEAFVRVVERHRQPDAGPVERPVPTETAPADTTKEAVDVVDR